MSRIGRELIYKKRKSVWIVRSKSPEFGGRAVYKHHSYFLLETSIYSGPLEEDY